MNKSQKKIKIIADKLNAYLLEWIHNSPTNLWYDECKRELIIYNKFVCGKQLEDYEQELIDYMLSVDRVKFGRHTQIFFKG